MSESKAETSGCEFPTFQFTVDQEELGMRLDVFVARRVDGLSRSKASELVKGGFVLINSKQPKPSVRLRSGDQVSATIAELKPELPIAEDIPLEILFEDSSIVAINKPPAMVVHPAKGHWQGTLTAALVHHFNQLSSIGGAQRPGIVHRLDRDSSGVILIAKSNVAHESLASQFEHRLVKKEYLAIVSPPPDRDRDEIDQPIGIHPYHREKMAIRADHKTSRTAQTYFETRRRAGRFGIVHAFPTTGRTHQIRVHLAHAGCPVLCDKLYSGRKRITRGELRTKSEQNRTDADDDEVVLGRQALHAVKIQFEHPTTGEPQTITAPLPADLLTVIDLL